MLASPHVSVCPPHGKILESVDLIADYLGPRSHVAQRVTKGGDRTGSSRSIAPPHQ